MAYRVWPVFQLSLRLSCLPFSCLQFQCAGLDCRQTYYPQLRIICYSFCPDTLEDFLKERPTHEETLGGIFHDKPAATESAGDETSPADVILREEEQGEGEEKEEDTDWGRLPSRIVEVLHAERQESWKGASPEVCLGCKTEQDKASHQVPTVGKSPLSSPSAAIEDFLRTACSCGRVSQLSEQPGQLFLAR